MSIVFNHSNDKYSFQSEFIKVEFSKPGMQACDEYGFCKSDREILYYYYKVEAYVKRRGKWGKFFNIGTYDFPELITFKGMLESILNNDIGVSNYQRISNGNRVLLSYTFDTSSLCEDFYSVTHNIIDGRGGSEFYSIVVGKPFNISCEDMISVSFNKLTRKDLENIYECVKGFVEYSIKKNNEIIINRNKEGINSWKIVDKKLYQMNSDGKSVDSVYVIGDIVSGAKVLHGDINSTDFYSTEFCNFKIDDITEDSIIFSSGYENKNMGSGRRIEAQEEIKIGVLIDIFDDVSEDKLRYDEEAITVDFISILSDSEKEEFKEKPVDFLYNKWKEAILNRTWMCRSEHNLPKRVEDKGNHENVYASIRVIVENIKNSLSAG